MADVNTDSGGGHGKHDKKRAKKMSTRIDMTPMVDLAFLLLTFFVMTSTFNKAKTLEMLYPADPLENQKPPKIKNALTFILSGDDKVFYYDGEFYVEGNADGKPKTELIETNYSATGIRDVLLKRNVLVTDSIEIFKKQYANNELNDSTLKKHVISVKRNAKALTVLVKTDDEATYKNVIDVMDELNITSVGKKAVVDLIPAELNLLRVKTGKAPIAEAVAPETK